MNFSSLTSLQESAAAQGGRLDLIFLAYLGYGVIRGIFRGLAEELAGLVGTLLVFLGAWKYYRPVAEAIRVNTRMEDAALAKGVAYVLMVLLFMVVWKLLILLLRKTLDHMFPDHLKRPGGALLGGLKSALALCVLLTAIQLSGIPFLKDTLVQGTRFGRLTQETVPGVLARWWPGLFPAESGAPATAVEAHGP